MLNAKSCWTLDEEPSVWFLETALPEAHDWDPVRKSAEGQSDSILVSRRVYTESTEVREFAYMKSDRRAPTAFYEKVAADLAAMLGLPVAGVLLHGSDGVVSAYSKSGPLCQSVSSIRALCGDVEAERLAPLYPWELWAFDAWIANDDRKESEVVLNERPRLHLYGIDHGAAFGVGRDGVSAWVNSFGPDGVKNIHSPPLPEFVSRVPWDRDAVIRTASDIASLDAGAVKFVVDRADDFYREHSAKSALIDRTAVTRTLLDRKDIMVKWSEVL